MEHRGMMFLVSDALERGARRITRSRFAWDVAGDCQNPLGVQHHSTPNDGPRTYVWREGKKHSLTLDMEVRCRRCPNCLRARARLWMGRTIGEFRQANRTWLVTLTLSPDSHVLMANRARLRLGKQGLDFDRLDSDEQFGERHSEISKEITKFLKRIRKKGHRFRYVIVAEAHKSGLPHYHLLIFEGFEQIPKQTIKEEWHLGFSRVKLSDIRGAWYVSKYLWKDARARVRASLRYGLPPSKGPKAPEG